MTKRIGDLIDEFAKEGKTEGEASNTYIKDDTLYSFGTPLLVRVPNWDKYYKSKCKFKETLDLVGTKGFLLNADRGEPGGMGNGGTVQHQWMCFNYATIQIPFSALEGAIPELFTNTVWDRKRDFSELRIVDKSKDRWDDLDSYDYVNSVSHEVIISKKEFEKLSDEEKLSTRQRQERRPESVVLEYHGRYYLSSMDENSYFISKLPKRVYTVEEAFECLKPKEVKDKIWQRQGEWFFVELPFSDKDKKGIYNSMDQGFILPKDDIRSNDHTATRGCWGMDIAFRNNEKVKYIKGNTPIVSGQIHHPEHKVLNLSFKKYGIKIFAAFKNTATGNWSAEGGVD